MSSNIITFIFFIFVCLYNKLIVWSKSWLSPEIKIYEIKVENAFAPTVLFIVRISSLSFSFSFVVFFFIILNCPCSK